MKKKTILLSTMLMGAVSFGLLTGFDNAATADDVLQKYVEASKDLGPVNADVNLDGQAAMEIPDAGTTIDLTAGGSMKLGGTLDPIQLGLDGTFQLSLMGENLNMGMQMYAVQNDDGSVSAYTGVDEGDGNGMQWSQDTLDAEEVSELTELLKNSNVDFTTMPIEFTLGSQPADVNGKECYALTSVLTWEDVKNVISYSTEAAKALVQQAGGDPDELDTEELTGEIASLDQYLNGLTANLEIDVDTETYKAQKAHLDLNGSDWSALGGVLSESMGLTDDEGNPMSVNLSVSNAALDITYDYDTPVSVNVPEEAKNAPEEDLDDVEEHLDSDLNAAGSDGTQGSDIGNKISIGSQG